MSLKRKLSSPANLVETLEWFMDFVAFAALYVTREVLPWAWAVALGLITLRVIIRYRLGTHLFAFGFFLLFGLTLFLCFGQGFHPLTAIVQTVPVLHALVIFTREKEKYQGWRIGVGFTELILAAAMTPEFTLPILVFLFVISALALVSCNFVVAELKKQGKDADTFELPQGFIGWIIRQGAIIFIASALIFPVLPRISQRNNSGMSSARTTGYTEEVNLRQWTEYSEGSSTPVVRIFADDPDHLHEYIFRGLLRSKVLNQFDGQSWKQVPSRAKTSLAYLPKYRDSPKKTLHFQREPLDTVSLPVPYGYSQIRIEQYGYSWVPERNYYEEVQEARFHHQKAVYRADFVTDPKEQREILLPKDEPTVYDSEVPQAIRDSRFARLAENLFRDLKEPRQKVSAVEKMFIDQRFSAADELSETGKSLYDPKLSPLENFVFRTREGNCELFSSTAATLLRLGGVPTRVIAGFRVTRAPVGNILTVRMSDAHAWVEVYYPDVGWAPLDSTPRILADLSVLDWVRDGYDWLSANWSQYVLNYGEDSNLLGAGIRSLRKNFEKWSQGEEKKSGSPLKESWELPVAFVGAALLIGLIFFTRRRPTGGMKSWQGTPALRRERAAMERLLRVRKLTPEDLIVRDSMHYQKWQSLYQSTRFGKTPNQESVAELRRALEDLKIELIRNPGHGARSA